MQFPCSDAFLDEAVGRIARMPKSLSLVYSAGDFSLLDLKVSTMSRKHLNLQVLLFRMADHFERSFRSRVANDRSVVLPSHFYSGLNKASSRSWSIFNNLCDAGSATRK